MATISCQKQSDWLNAKRQQSDIVPSTLDDFQAILDNSAMNTNYPMIGQLGADNYYIPDDNIGVISSVEKNAYLWTKDIFEGAPSSDYTFCYIIVGYANIVLEGLANLEINVADQERYNSITGQALFFRASMFCELAGVFCKPFDNATAATDLGICVRTKSNVNQIEPRATVQRTYDQIVNDLKLAIPLLPVSQSHKTRPSKSAAFALLARVYLLMGDYQNAKRFADSTLEYANSILDFNGSSVSLSRPYRFPDFSTGNDEIIFYAYAIGYGGTIPSESLSRSYVDSVLYGSYDNDDLRKLYFFSTAISGKPKFRGTYAGIGRNFSGIAVNEVYLIRAECNARLNNPVACVSDINFLLERRYRTGTYTPFNTTDADVALIKVLEERRKELPFTGQIRWQDLRRLNKEPGFAKTLLRNVGGVQYQLPANDRRYVYPFPQNEIDHAGIQQNER